MCVRAALGCVRSTLRSRRCAARARYRRRCRGRRSRSWRCGLPRARRGQATMQRAWNSSSIALLAQALRCGCHHAHGRAVELAPRWLRCVADEAARCAEIFFRELIRWCARAVKCTRHAEFTRLLEHAAIPLDTNRVENAIRPFVIGGPVRNSVCEPVALVNR